MAQSRVTNVKALIADITMNERIATKTSILESRIRPAIGNRISPRIFISSEMPKSAPAIIAPAYHLCPNPQNNTHDAAMPGASVGTSIMQEELSSRNPGDASSNIAVMLAQNNPPNRNPIKKTDASVTAANPIVTSRGPAIDELTCFTASVIRNVCNGGWSHQTSV